MSLRILIATHCLGWRTGSEAHTRDLALGLSRRGHAVAVLAPKLLEDADARALRATGICVTDRLSDVPWKPDTIHGHHWAPTILACAAFPEAPALQVCHDATQARDRAAPGSFVQLRCAVDEFCRARVARETGLESGDIPLLPNAVDLEAFPARAESPATPPAKAILFHSSGKDEVVLEAADGACAALGIALRRVGPGSGCFLGSPAAALLEADLVFAKARCALEALACGCHVILLGEQGLGPAITPESLEKLRRRNLGRSLLTERASTEAIVARIRELDPARTAVLTQMVRAHCGIDSLAARAEALHLRIAAVQPRRPKLARIALGSLARLHAAYYRCRRKKARA